MGMTADNHVKARSGRAHADGVQIVQHVNLDGPNVRHLRFGDRFCPIAFIRVSANRHDRRKRSQPFQHVRCADVAGVKNEIGARERADGFRT